MQTTEEAVEQFVAAVADGAAAHSAIVEEEVQTGKETQLADYHRQGFAVRSLHLQQEEHHNHQEYCIRQLVG